MNLRKYLETAGFTYAKTRQMQDVNLIPPTPNQLLSDAEIAQCFPATELLYKDSVNTMLKFARSVEALVLKRNATDNLNFSGCSGLNLPLVRFLETVSVRTKNVVNSELGGRKNPLTVRHLVMLSRSEMRRWPNFGKKGLNEIEENLRALGLQLWEEHDKHSLQPLLASSEKQ